MSSNGISLNTLTQIVELAAAYETLGGSSLLQAAGKHALSQTATASLRNTFIQMGIPTSTQNSLLASFTQNFNSASGNSTTASAAVQTLLDASFRNGGLAQSAQQLTDAMTRLTMALGAKGQQDSGGAQGGSGDSWLEAIARAMGQALGTMAQNLVNESNQLSSLSGNSSGSGAQQFQSVMTQFQAHSQLFGMLSDAFSNAIKSIGQGMQTMGSKT